MSPVPYGRPLNIKDAGTTFVSQIKLYSIPEKIIKNFY